MTGTLVLHHKRGFSSFSIVCAVLHCSSEDISGWLTKIYSFVARWAQLAFELVLNIRPPAVSTLPPTIFAGQTSGVFTAASGSRVGFLYFSFNCPSPWFNYFELYSFFTFMCSNIPQLLRKFSITTMQTVRALILSVDLVRRCVHHLKGSIVMTKI